ncbi:MAG: PASTA domain-containing protein [Lachnospiraceae bacterium]|nr:PASTA domain-containing protein [Lachnospiraceae bacterium]
MLRRCMGCMEEYDEKFDVCPHCGFVYGTDTNETFHLSPSSIVGDRYIIGKVIGYGGFGVTYIGWDALLEQKVAIKEYFPNEFATRVHGEEKLTVYSGDKYEQFTSGLEKFITESKCLSKLQDIEGIVRIFDCFEQNNTAYIIMEYLEGVTLKEVLEAEKKIDIDTAIAYIKPILYALDRVHQEGIVHRDIAPDNIFITNDGQVKIIDFGASRYATTKHSRSLSIIIKQGYSPEEQYRSKGDQGPWTDVYSVAATFYKMITGVTPDDAMERSANDKLKEPSKLGVKLDKSTENSIMNALNVKIEGRTQSAREFLDDLEAEEVKRIKVKNRKMDIGKWPLWLKISSSAAALALVVFVSLMATGVIKFNTKELPANYLPEGCTRVPNVINMERENAQERCDKNEIIFQIYDKTYSNDIEKDKILSQSLYGGSITENGTTLLVVASAGAQKVQVPDLVGYMESDAINMLDETDLVYTENYIESSIKPSAVVSQSIEAGLLVEAGSNIDLDISKGLNYDISIDTTVPDLVNHSFDEGTEIVRNSALYIFKSGSEYSDTIPAGTIMSQYPDAGATVKQGDVVEVIISLGKEQIIVPDVEFKHIDDAKEQLEKLGFVVETEYVEDNAVAKDHVVSQSIEADQIVDKGSIITLKVSEGNELAQIDENSISVDTFVTYEMQQDYDNNTYTTEEVVQITEEYTPNNVSYVEVSDNLENSNTANNNSSQNNKNEATTESDVIIPSTTEIQYEPVEKVETVTMPNLIGLSETEAEESLLNTGLNYNTTYKHNEEKADYTVLSQGTTAGSSIIKGNTVTLVVCNNEKVTEYSTCKLKEETTNSTASSLEGWELYDSSTDWSDYGSWNNEWLTTKPEDSESREIKTKTQYSYSDYQTTTDSSSYMDGWTCTGSSKTGYTPWSDYKYSTDTKTESEVVHIVGTSTKYYYYHYHNKYTNGTEGIDSTNEVGKTGSDGVTIASNLYYCSLETTEELPKTDFKDVGGRQAYKKKGTYNCSYNNFNNWWSNGSVTTYTYQTRDYIYTYTFERWTPDTDWSDTEPEKAANRIIKTRTLYQYRDRSLVTTYYYKRKVYDGDWSAWSETPASESDTLAVKTREVYRYN